LVKELLILSHITRFSDGRKDGKNGGAGVEKL